MNGSNWPFFKMEAQFFVRYELNIHKHNLDLRRFEGPNKIKRLLIN
jgi:hypothetical protein